MYVDRDGLDYFIRLEPRHPEEPRIWLWRCPVRRHASIEGRFFNLMINVDIPKRWLTARAWAKWKASTDAYWIAENARMAALRQASQEAQAPA